MPRRGCFLIQGGGHRNIAIGQPLPLRHDFDVWALRAAARRSKDAAQVRRLLTLAAIYDGASRSEAARVGTVTLQIVRDWVIKFNAQGPEGLLDRKAPGQPPTLTEAHRAALAAFQPPPRVVEVAWGRNWSPLSNMAGSVPAADRQRLEAAQSIARAESALVTSRVARQRSLTLPGLYATEAAARSTGRTLARLGRARTTARGRHHRPLPRPN
ncbi:helix-turn-helix domain-containing protein [Sediminicoccus sp. BL-A-41-H5]|uniref:helix-turn-helix domain-containing protein n=1 Tax=Sediminicoccus sp. BL-A-41-H5 TaxID=3421106 RepID=UPI003D66AD17